LSIQRQWLLVGFINLLVFSSATKSPSKMTVSCVEHNAVTIALSKKESAEHLEAMGGLYDHYRTMPLLVKAYAFDDPNAPSTTKDNVKGEQMNSMKNDAPM